MSHDCKRLPTDGHCEIQGNGHISGLHAGRQASVRVLKVQACVAVKIERGQSPWIRDRDHGAFLQ